MPSRIIKKSATSMPGFFPSLKNPDGVMFESTVERDYCYYLELDSTVRFYEGQPLTIHFEIDGKKRRYTPDFLVQFHLTTDKHLVEVKRQKALLKDDDGMVFKLNYVREEFNRLGYSFEVKTDDVIRTKPRLGNLKTIHKYLRYKLASEDKATILKLLKEDRKYLISEISIETGMSDVMAKILHLAAKSEIIIDLTAPINLQSLVWNP